jgi:hypothetical protein
MGTEGGELPAFDGADPPPRPNATGPAGTAFLGWEAGLNPFLGGSFGAARTGSVANPAGLILSALGNEGDGDGTGRGGGSDGDDQTGRFIRGIILRELDPENNPRALLEALASLRGIAATSAGYRAAEAAIQHFERGDML